MGGYLFALPTELALGAAEDEEDKPAAPVWPDAAIYRPATAAASRGQAYGPEAPPPIFGDSPQAILSGPLREGGMQPSVTTEVFPAGSGIRSVSVDRSRGLSGQDWIDSVKGNPEHSWYNASRGWTDPASNRLMIPSDGGPSTFDEMVASRQPSAASMSRLASASEDGSGLLMPGSERFLGTVGQGDNAWIMGDIGARKEQARGRGVGLDEMLAEVKAAEMRQKQAQAEALTRDPFAKERLQGQQEKERVLAVEELRGKIASMSAQEKRDSYAAAADQIEQRFEASRAAAKSEAEIAAAEATRERSLETLDSLYGVKRDPLSGLAGST